MAAAKDSTVNIDEILGCGNLVCNLGLINFRSSG